MKIALIGEFSGVHAGLKAGLEALGHKVDIYSNGDTFKKIKSDKRLYPAFRGILDKLNYYCFGFPKLFKFIANNYDIIQIVNPHVISGFKNSPLYYKFIINKLATTKSVKSLAAVGCEANTQRGLSTLVRSPCSGCLKDYNLPTCPFISDNNIKITRYAEKFAEHIIPFGGPSYAKSYNHHSKYREAIPFAVDIDFLPPRINKLGRKIKILHGINRAGFKGSDIILEALKKIEFDYPNDFEIIIPDKLPFEQYAQLLLNVNVVVDQLYGDGLGMNALYSMGASCVVFSCFDRISIGKLDLTTSPAIQIDASIEEIYRQIYGLKSWSTDDFIVIGNKSRQFVLENYSPIKVAKQVLDYWATTVNKP